MAEAYPTLAAGQRLTASLLRSMQAQVVRKTADTSRSATTTAADDPHLVFDVEANAVYTMWGWIKYFADPTPDIQFKFVGPTGALGEWAWNPPGSGTAASSTAGYSIRTETNDINVARAGYGTSDTQMYTPVSGCWRIGSTAGTIAFQWAQNSSNATASIVYTDSWLAFLRVA